MFRNIGFVICHRSNKETSRTVDFEIAQERIDLVHQSCIATARCLVSDSWVAQVCDESLPPKGCSATCSLEEGGLNAYPERF
jgi:hypothetical protein